MKEPVFRSLEEDIRPMGFGEGKPSPFEKPHYAKTLKLLESELAKVCKPYSQPVIEVDVAPEYFSVRHGTPKSTAKWKTQAVRVSFEHHNAGPLRIPCWQFDNWQCNLRAIALTLHDLRRIERYGTSPKAESYRGWSALPPAKVDEPAGFATVEEAETYLRGITLLYVKPGGLISNPDLLRKVWHDVSKKTHPDTGGTPELFARAAAAKKLIEQGGGR